MPKGSMTNSVETLEEIQITIDGTSGTVKLGLMTIKTILENMLIELLMC